MNKEAEDLARKVTQLASFPDVAFRVNDLLADENSGADAFGAVIEPDPALNAALLRLANSAMYSVGGTVSSVARAVTVVGLREVRDLAFGICATKAFEGIPNELTTVEDFWKHSLYCAVASRNIGKLSQIGGGDSLFTAGLLHDIGHLAMFNQDPVRSRASLELSIEQSDGLSPYLSEREVFGFDHMDVGASLAEQWDLPETLRASIAHHHEPFDNDAVIDTTLVVHVANSVAVLAELDSRDFADAPPIDDRVLAELKLEKDILLEQIPDVRESVDQLIRIFVS